ncbi:MAG: hypothetical protein ACTHME_06225 [Candidatus Nitrosocosmicus sp.]
MGKKSNQKEYDEEIDGIIVGAGVNHLTKKIVLHIYDKENKTFTYLHLEKDNLLLATDMIINSLD